MDEQERAWRQLADEAFAHLTQWRREHPTATFAEIEAATDTHLAAVRARMLRDVALASAAVSTPTTCPACGARMQARGKETRTLVTTHDQAIALRRTRAVCPACGAGLFPP
jgi:YgiT-type zinc finger domain-containing protein